MISSGYHAGLPQMPAVGVLSYAIHNVQAPFRKEISYWRCEIIDLKSLEVVLHDIMISQTPGS